MSTEDYKEGASSSGHTSEGASGMTPKLVDTMTDSDLQKMKTNATFVLSPEMFEKMYLSPDNKVSGDLRKTFANPTGLYVVPRPLMSSES